MELYRQGLDTFGRRWTGHLQPWIHEQLKILRPRKVLTIYLAIRFPPVHQANPPDLQISEKMNPGKDIAYSRASASITNLPHINCSSLKISLTYIGKINSAIEQLFLEEYFTYLTNRYFDGVFPKLKNNLACRSKVYF